jgi:hypothetical protein
MRIAACSCLSLALLACAPASSPEPAAEPPAQPAEVEGPAPTHESASAPNDACALGPVDEWSACDGKRVQLQGRAAEHVAQHPVLAVPEDVTPDGSNSQQGYVDAQGVQLIVLTKTPFECRGPLRVIGTLRSVDMGGEPGTKSSYSGWAIEDAEVTCE